MTSLASALLNDYNGVQPIEALAKPKKAAPQPAPVMSEELLEAKETLRGLLRAGIWTVKFTKKDGTESVMECTLDPQHLPKPDPVLITEAPRTKDTEAPHLLHVYAVDRQGWRSFIVPNVLEVTPKVTT